jgi:cephalosporin hydroxylase
MDKEIIINHYQDRRNEVSAKKNPDNLSVFDEKGEIRGKIYDELITEDSLIVEVGVRLGENACLMFLRNPKKMILIDPWIQSGSYPHHSKNNKFYQRVSNVFSNFDNVEILRQKSEDAHEKFEDSYFDLVYVDSGHTRVDVLRDLNLWSKKIKVGGYIVGDDYFGKRNPDSRIKWKQHKYGVIEALDEFLENNSNFKIYKSENLSVFPLPVGQFVLVKTGP